MSALGQKRTCAVHKPMSALCQKRTCTALVKKRTRCAALFNDLVGNGKNARRNCKAERFRGFEIDHQLELGRLHDRQVGGLLALENARRVDTCLAVGVRLAGAIAHQATRHHGFAQRDRWLSKPAAQRTPRAADAGCGREKRRYPLAARLGAHGQSSRKRPRGQARCQLVPPGCRAQARAQPPLPRAPRVRTPRRSGRAARRWRRTSVRAHAAIAAAWPLERSQGT